MKEVHYEIKKASVASFVSLLHHQRHLEINQLGRHGSQKGQLSNNTMADVHLPSFVYSLCIVTCRLMRSEVAAECSGAAANESRHNMWSFISSFRPVSPDGSPEEE